METRRRYIVETRRRYNFQIQLVSDIATTWYLTLKQRIFNVILSAGPTLETRILRGDQIEVFKIVNGYEDVDRNMFFKLKEGSRTRGHKAALVKEQCRLDMRKYSFSQRVINEWNKLPNYCVNASSVNMFKNRIDRYLIRAGYT